MLLQGRLYGLVSLQKGVTWSLTFKSLFMFIYVCTVGRPRAIIYTAVQIVW